MEETKQTDVSSLPEVQPNKKAKKSLSEKQRHTLEEGRKKRWLKKQKEIRDQEKDIAKNAEVENNGESVEEEIVSDQIQNIERKRYDEEPLRWTERLKLAEEETGDDQQEEEGGGGQEEESDQYEEEGGGVEQDDLVAEEESGSDVGSDTYEEEEERTVQLPRNFVRPTTRELSKFQTPPSTTRRIKEPKIPQTPRKSSRQLLKDKVRSTLVERLVDRYLENKTFHTSDNKRLGEMMFY